MKKLLFTFFLLTCSFTGLYSQATLFDEGRVSAVYIEIPPDSLAVIMTDVLSEHYFKALFIYDFGTGRDTLAEVGFRLRGNTSRFSQKKSFKISFNEYVSGRKYQGVKKINLNGQHNDPTMVREKLFYDSWQKAGMAERRSSFVRLYINHAYYGLYTNLEEFDKDWLLRVYGENSGNLYKCTYPADLVYYNANPQTYKNIQSGSSTGGRAYDLQTNEAEDDYTDLVELISALNKPVDAAFESLIAQKINVDGLLKAFAIDVASGNWDDYMYNKNNYFLYHRAETGKFEFISYDTDNTFGVDWVNRDWTTRNCLDWFTHSESRPLAEKILAVPAFQARYQRYLDTIANEIINPIVIFTHIDSLKVLITDAALADTYRTLDYGYSASDFHGGFTQTIDNHTPYGIKPFLTKRFTTMLQQLSTASVAETENRYYPMTLFPNPAENEMMLSLAASLVDRPCLIRDLAGRQHRSMVMAKNRDTYSIPLSGLVPGVYILAILNDGNWISQLFVKK